jgi:hypothetical protein
MPSTGDLDDPIGFAQHAGELSDIDIADFLTGETTDPQDDKPQDDGDNPSK